MNQLIAVVSACLALYIVPYLVLSTQGGYVKTAPGAIGFAQWRPAGMNKGSLATFYAPLIAIDRRVWHPGHFTC